MTPQEYDEFCESTDLYKGDDKLVAYILGLNEEAGEVAGKLKKYMRGDYANPDWLFPDLLNEALADFSYAVLLELGDVLWYNSRVANLLGSSMSEVMTLNKSKLMARTVKGTLRGSGDHR